MTLLCAEITVLTPHRQFDDARDFMTDKVKTEGVKELIVSLKNVYRALQLDQRKRLAPMIVFVDSMMPVQKRMADILPNKPVCDRLLDAYIAVSEGLYRIIHIPTFRVEYESYWEGGRCSEGFLPRLLGVISIGSRFNSESRGLGHDRSDSIHMPTACALVRSWLDSLRGKQLVDFTTLQAEVLLLHGQRMITPRNQDSWTQMGFIVRMAMTMGLHRDPSEFPQVSIFAGELRRRLWFTIMDLDLHLALACNLSCCVKESEYTCRPPRNLDDDELYPEMKELPPAQPIDHMTTMQLQSFAASTLPYRLKAASILSRLDTVEDYHEVIDVGSKLERLVDDVIYLFPRNQSLDPRGLYKEWRDRALLDMHIRRTLVALYRPFALSTVDCPAEITASYVKSCMTILTYIDELDPVMAGFADVEYMYNLILRHDITQAAFSICYYIKEANESGSPYCTAPRHGNGTASPSPVPGAPAGSEPQGGYANVSNTRMLWSPASMSEVVEKRLQGLIASVRGSSGDLKDVAALAVVLASVQPGGTPEQRLELKKEGTRKVFHACLRALNRSAGQIAPASVSATVKTGSRKCQLT